MLKLLLTLRWTTFTGACLISLDLLKNGFAASSLVATGKLHLLTFVHASKASA